MIYVSFLLLLSAALFLFWASSNIRSNIYLTCINNNPTIKDNVAITFDDGPDPLNTVLILDLLEKYNAKATFFLIGKKIEEYEAIAKEIHSRGHVVGNHSYTHNVFFPLNSLRSMKNDLTLTNNLIKKITNIETVYFRPPFGVTNPTISKAVKHLNMIPVGWSIRSLDTKNERAEIVFKRIVKKLKGGDIILLHDTSANILDILDMLLQYMAKNSLYAVSIDKMR